jgi:hypothetical protein
MLRPMLVLLAVAGCDWRPERGNAVATPPEQLYLDMPDQTLPSAVVGEQYDAVIQVTGGSPPYTFAEIEPPPGGLSLTSDGHLRGRIAQAGAYTFSVLAVDGQGRSKLARITLTAVLEPLLVGCGETIDGRFVGSAMGPGGNPELAELDALAWIAVDLPDELVTRVDLTFRNAAPATLYVEQPNELLGSWDIEDLYVAKAVESGVTSVVTIDAGTDPSLTGFATQTLLPMVLVGQATGGWELTVECSDGPVFTTLLQYPSELGAEFLYDFDVYGADNAVTRIWTEDRLPRWILWDEATGIVTSESGLAEAPGTWEITIQAETADGRRRRERAVFGVYDVRTVPCGGRVDLTVDESYFDGEFTGYYDPKGYDVFRVDLADQRPSSITLGATGSDSHYLGLAEPNPDWLKFYGGAERVYLDGETSLYVEPRTYPASHHYADQGELFFSAASTGTDLDGVEVYVECDFTPLPDLAALPVFAPLQVVDLPLDAIGGEPPYTWSATGLPVGLALQRDGRLTGSTSQVGTFPVTLTVTDKNGLRGSRDYDLRVGSDDACLGHKRVYCGDSLSNEFTVPYYSDDGSKDSTRTFCIIDDSDRSIGIELYSEEGQYRVDIADPGIDDPDDVVSPSRSTYVAFVDRNAVEGVSIDPFSWPDIDDYQNLPIFVTLRAYDPGGWTAHFVCTP